MQALIRDFFFTRITFSVSVESAVSRGTKIFGKKIAARRRELFLTQAQLGAAIGGMSDENVGRIERSDVAGILTKQIPRLAEVLKVPLEVFTRDYIAEAAREQTTTVKTAPIKLVNGGSHPPLTDIAVDLEALDDAGLARLGLKVLERLWPKATTKTAKDRIHAAIIACRELSEKRPRIAAKPLDKGKSG